MAILGVCPTRWIQSPLTEGGPITKTKQLLGMKKERELGVGVVMEEDIVGGPCLGLQHCGGGVLGDPGDFE